MNYQVMPPLTNEEYEELKADIKERGVMVPIEFDDAGNVLDGHHRLQICEELGITVYPKIIRNGMTEEEKRTHARRLNMARRQLNREQKQQLIREQLMETPERSDRQIGRELGVHPTTVGTQRRTLEESGQVSKLDTSIGSDGKQYPRQVERKQPEAKIDEQEFISACVTEINKNKGYVNLDDVAAGLVTRQPVPESAQQPVVQESEIEPEWASSGIRVEQETHYAPPVIEAGGPVPEWWSDETTDVPKTEPAKKPHVVNNSTDNEWYTPAEYIEAAREVMGGIDLDPASNDFANETVKAGKYFTEEQDGTKQDWFGNVWLNPPYSTDMIMKFAEKVEQSEFNQAIVLVNNASETRWYQKLWKNASAMVGPAGRIKFRKRDGEHGVPLQGQTFFYYGNNPKRFLSVFLRFGMGTIVSE